MADAVFVFFKAEYLSLGTPGFTLLVNLVVEGSIWTCSARTCADNHSVHSVLAVNLVCVCAKVMCLFLSLLTSLGRFLAFVTLLDTKCAVFITTGESFFTAALCVMCGRTLFH